MNKSRFFQVLALSVVTTLVAYSEEGVLTKAMQSGPSGTSDPKPVTKKEDFFGNKVAAPPRGIEFRIGPVFNMENDIHIQTGPRGQAFGVDTLNMEKVSYGAKIDFDVDSGRGLRFYNGLTWIHFEQNGTLEHTLTYGSGVKLLRGTNLETELDIFKYEPKLGYDVIKTENYRLTPYGGAILGVETGTVTAVSGRMLRENRKVSQIDKRKEYNQTEFFATYLLGFENQFHFTRTFYAGLDLGGYYLDFLNGATGKGYFAYDFNESLGLRVGCDVDWASYDDRNIKFEGYTTTPYIQLGVKF